MSRKRGEICVGLAGADFFPFSDEKCRRAVWLWFGRACRKGGMKIWM
ncbi:hypothetical protein KE531_09880 [Eubacteriaceae bacterium Marseille-Q4139]|nr:hypothetical protein [Eubacteriaceae bacterium Marseille-Q4139]